MIMTKEIVTWSGQLHSRQANINTSASVRFPVEQSSKQCFWAI